MTPEALKQVGVFLRKKQVVFWDFDGVIKDSIEVKSTGYEQLFLSYGDDVVKKVCEHHNAHGGISRYEKIPLYLSWVGEPASADQVKLFCDRFSKLVQQAVIETPWVPGVFEYLQANHTSQIFILITATPQEEIEQILCAIDINNFFREVHGAPTAKAMVVQDVMNRLRFNSDQTLVVGDSATDLSAAEENNVAFLLRRTPFNQSLQKQFHGPSFENLSSKVL
jgi:phosphoglycolate phosphatase-like HAD superfamily hydrolase